MKKNAKKTAVILFNLGGPDNLRAVKPFLFNLFNDAAIIRLPKVLRWLLAKFIAARRTATAQKIYAAMGGKSPILEQTEAQAEALKDALGGGFETFVVMRYWHPRAEAVLREVKHYQPDQVVLLPLYPQYSTTTTASSFNEWIKVMRSAGVSWPTKAICCYPLAQGWIGALASLTRPILASLNPKEGPIRLLITAHSLPERIVAQGDPYADQIQASAKALVEALDWSGEWRLCYQSKVGPLSWLKPSTEEEIRLAGREGYQVVLVPIAFVSEHSETLVELDQEYREVAEKAGVIKYARVSTVQTHPEFIKSLAKHIQTLGKDKSTKCAQGFPCAINQSCGARLLNQKGI